MTSKCRRFKEFPQSDIFVEFGLIALLDLQYAFQFSVYIENSVVAIATGQ